MLAMETHTQPVLRDGQHDFDFFFGKWNVLNRRLANPLRGPERWLEFPGTIEVRGVWGGKANFDEGVWENPLGTVYGCTMRFYDEQTRLWSIYWGTFKNGLTVVPTVGAFKDDGTGEFFNEEIFEGEPIICRFRWFKEWGKGCRWEQGFSTDGGASYQTNWIMEFTRA